MVTKVEFREWLKQKPKNDYDGKTYDPGTVRKYVQKLDDYNSNDYRKSDTRKRFSETDTILNPHVSLFEILDTSEKAREFRDAANNNGGYETKKAGGKWGKPQSDLTAAVNKLAEMLKEREARLCRNLLYFGAPGTGKSYEMNSLAQEYFEGRMERVTFYADYLHSQFVGAYKPVSRDKAIDYVFQPGPFIRVLVKALNDPSNNYGLIIEELNRAEAASVFGDLFQLLDRDNDGVSQYPVSVSEDLKAYLAESLKGAGAARLDELVKKALGLKEQKADEKASERKASSTNESNADGDGSNNAGNDDKRAEKCDAIVIPGNMYIWATMNSADQGVFPLDTAFKRRWTFEYFGVNKNESWIDDSQAANAKDWNLIRKAINGRLMLKGVNEDKCMGPFFLNSQELGDGLFGEAFKNKVIMYLYEDAARYLRSEFFGSGKSLGDLFDAWDNSKDKSNKGRFESVFGGKVQVEWDKASKDGSADSDSVDSPDDASSNDGPEDDSSESTLDESQEA